MSALDVESLDADAPRHRSDARESLEPELQVPPPSIGGTLGKLLDRLSSFSLLLASLALVVLIVIFGWLVFGRYVLNDTPTWVEQMSLLLVIVITFLGSASLVHEDRHLGVTFLRDALPDRIRLGIRLVCDITIAAFGVFMVIGCSRLVAFSWGNDLPMLGIPEGTRSLPAVIAGALIALFAGLRSVAVANELFGRRDRSPSP